jgi:hypothetical protein
MNKAFVREPDDTAPLCPLCGAQGESVPETALARYVPADQRHRLGGMVYFCETPTCEAVYYDAVEDYVPASQLTQAVYPKDPAAPMCACFGLTSQAIDQDLAEGSPRRIREILAQAQTPAAHCSEAAANGRCCIPALQKYYLRRFQQR